VDKYKENTPALKKGSTRLFRNLRDKGNLFEILCKLLVFHLLVDLKVLFFKDKYMFISLKKLES